MKKPLLSILMDLLRLTPEAKLRHPSEALTWHKNQLAASVL
jgi:hypothetical protein